MNNNAFDGDESVQSRSQKVPQRPIRRRKLHEDVADQLLHDIRSGAFPVGSFLPSESALMREFGVGRPAVRDSLAKLARMGLLELKPGVRPKVCKLDMTPLMNEFNGVVKMLLEDPDGLRHMQQIRVLMESTLARVTARIIQPRQLRAAWELLEEFRQVMESKQERTRSVIGKLSDLDFLFHRSIVDVVANPIVALLQQSLYDWLVGQRIITLGFKNQPEVTYAAHRRIYNSLAARDPNKAEQEMTDHIEQVNSVFQDVVNR